MLDCKLSHLKDLVRVIWLYRRRTEQQKRSVLLILKAYEQQDRR